MNIIEIIAYVILNLTLWYVCYKAGSFYGRIANKNRKINIIKEKIEELSEEIKNLELDIKNEHEDSCEKEEYIYVKSKQIIALEWVLRNE